MGFPCHPPFLAEGLPHKRQTYAFLQGSAAHHGDLRKGDHIVVWGGVNVRDDVQLDCLVAKSLVKATVVDVDVLRRNTKTSKQIIYFSIDIKVSPKHALGEMSCKEAIPPAPFQNSQALTLWELKNRGRGKVKGTPVCTHVAYGMVAVGCCTDRILKICKNVLIPGTGCCCLQKK